MGITEVFDQELDRITRECGKQHDATILATDLFADQMWEEIEAVVRFVATGHSAIRSYRGIPIERSESPACWGALRFPRLNKRVSFLPNENVILRIETDDLGAMIGAEMVYLDA